MGFILESWEWNNRVIAELTKQGKRSGIAGRFLNAFGRRRCLTDPSLSSRERMRRAVNFLLQGQVADLIKQAQVRLYRELLQRKMKARIVLQLHDALYVSVPEDEISLAVALLESTMS